MKKQKHILFISCWYPNRNNPTHGIFNSYFAKAASLYNKVSVIHVCSDRHLKKKFELVNEIKDEIPTIIVYYKKINSTIPFISNWQKRNRVIKAYELAFKTLISKQGAPQLIQLNVVLPAGIGVAYLSKKYHIPYVVNENWSGYTKEDGNYSGPLQKHFTKKIINGAKKIMPTSNYLKEAMIAHNLTGDYEVVPNVVDVRRFVPLNVDTGPKIKLIHISSLIEREKNVSGIINSFANALKVNSNIELVIVGEGENRVMLTNLTKSLGIETQITFKGRLSGEKLVQAINDCNALIMFSHFETFCLVIIEAFACGKPVITSNAGAIPSYMNNQLGLMVTKNNENELTDAILKFAKNPSIYDRDYIRAFAEKFSYENVGKQMDAIYEEVILDLN